MVKIAVPSLKKDIAAQIVNEYGSENVKFAVYDWYTNEIKPIAKGLTPDCNVHKKVLETLLAVLETWGNVKINMLTIDCLSNSQQNALIGTTCAGWPTLSHCQADGPAIDLGLVGGVSVNGSDKHSREVLGALNAFAPYHSWVGQLNCRDETDHYGRLNEKDDPNCNHIHFDVQNVASSDDALTTPTATSPTDIDDTILDAVRSEGGAEMVAWNSSGTLKARVQSSAGTQISGLSNLSGAPALTVHGAPAVATYGADDFAAAVTNGGVIQVSRTTHSGSTWSFGTPQSITAVSGTTVEDLAIASAGSTVWVFWHDSADELRASSCSTSGCSSVSTASGNDITAPEAIGYGSTVEVFYGTDSYSVRARKHTSSGWEDSVDVGGGNIVSSSKPTAYHNPDTGTNMLFWLSPHSVLSRANQDGSTGDWTVESLVASGLTSSPSAALSNTFDIYWADLGGYPARVQYTSANGWKDVTRPDSSGKVQSVLTATGNVSDDDRDIFWIDASTDRIDGDYYDGSWQSYTQWTP